MDIVTVFSSVTDINKTIIIIITRPKPARQRMAKRAGSWGQDTVQTGTFWGVLNVSLRASGAQLGSGMVVVAGKIIGPGYSSSGYI